MTEEELRALTKVAGFEIEIKQTLLDTYEGVISKDGLKYSTPLYDTKEQAIERILNFLYGDVWLFKSQVFGANTIELRRGTYTIDKPIIFTEGQR